MPHDHWLALWCALRGGVRLSPDALHRYRPHGRNVIGIGTSGLLYRWLGIWRHPRRPRERELRIWAGVTQRLAGSARPGELALARDKPVALVKGA